MPIKYCQYNFSGENTNIFKSFRSVKVFPTSQHFAWGVLFNNVPTKENLVHRGVGLDSTL